MSSIDTIDNIVDDLMKLRADAIEKVLKSKDIDAETAQEEGYSLDFKYNDDGTETITLMKAEPVASLTFSYSVKVTK